MKTQRETDAGLPPLTSLGKRQKTQERFDWRNTPEIEAGHVDKANRGRGPKRERERDTESEKLTNIALVAVWEPQDDCRLKITHNDDQQNPSVKNHDIGYDPAKPTPPTT